MLVHGPELREERSGLPELLWSHWEDQRNAALEEDRGRSERVLLAPRAVEPEQAGRCRPGDAGFVQGIERDGFDGNDLLRRMLVAESSLRPR
jgi:hypothetical protein